MNEPVFKSCDWCNTCNTNNLCVSLTSFQSTISLISHRLIVYVYTVLINKSQPAYLSSEISDTINGKNTNTAPPTNPLKNFDAYK